jgi:C-terminal processing protease CtpA/Prc
MFLLTLERMLAELRDGQAGAAGLRLQPSGRLPLLWEWVEGRLVITRRGPEAPEEIRAGDVVTAMSNLSVEEAVRAAESITSGGTPAHRRRRALEELARGPAGRPVRLDLQRPDGAVYTVEVARIDLGPNAGAGANTGTGPNTGTGVPSTRPALREARPPQLAEVGIGVRYCDLCGVDEDSLRALLPALAAARGVVLDLRGCSDTPAILDHLIGAPVDAPRVQVPVVTRPDREALTYQESSQQRTPAEPRLRGRAAFLIDASVTGNAEIALSIVERERLAEIVGENSAGSCGDIALVPLAGGYAIQFTETRVVKPDGSRLFGVGVRPTVPVARTIAGIAGRHDEILERAVDLLREAATTR